MDIKIAMIKKKLEYFTTLSVLKRFNPVPNKPWFLCVGHTNTAGKREIICYEQFLPFPQFSTILGNFAPFLSNLKLLCANFFSLEESKICHLGKG